MTPNEAINKLQRMQKWGKMTDVKQEALVMGIKAILYHELAEECVLRKQEGCLFFKDGEHGGEADKTTILMYCCPTCGEEIKMKSPKIRCQPFPKYCSNCGKKLKPPKGEQDEN